VHTHGKWVLTAASTLLRPPISSSARASRSPGMTCSVPGNQRKPRHRFPFFQRCLSPALSFSEAEM
jgi:hypothetical protein